MSPIIFSLVFVFLTHFLIEPTACVLPTDLQTLELDDIASLRHEIPLIINKINKIVNQVQCPKGWRYFGGSCYYLSKISSTPIQANHTCNLMNSNLMKIHNRIELYYAVYFSTKNNLSTLMIDIDRDILKDNEIILMNDQNKWQNMKVKFHKSHDRYYELKNKIIDELNTVGLRILKRSNIYNDYNEHNKTNSKYEYNNFDSENENDEFKQIDNIQEMCDKIEWNIQNTNSTIYMLTTSLISNKIICSLNNIEPNKEYRHICEYVLNSCFANIKCGKHGHCVNTLSGFKCSCSFLYGGQFCEKISNQGKQIIIGSILICVLYGLTTKLIRWILSFILSRCIMFCKNSCRKRQFKNDTRISEDYERAQQEQYNQEQHSPIIIQNQRQYIFTEKSNSNKNSLIRSILIGILSILFLTLLLSLTIIIQFTSLKYDKILDTMESAIKCTNITITRTTCYILSPISVILIFIFSWTIRRNKKCLHLWNGRLSLISPIQPFRTENRFITAAVFGILAFGILKTFEEILFTASDRLNDGALIGLLQMIGRAILIGLRYYPILASLQLRNIIVRCLAFLYMAIDITYIIILEGPCMNFLPTSGYYSGLENVKLRMELGTQFFIIYGLIKHIPHFMLLSYIAAELLVRFVYDSIYIPIKKKRNIWSSSIVQSEDYAYSQYYVTKLLREKRSYNRKINVTNMNNDIRFTTIVICAYTVVAVFLYYLSCTFTFLYISKERDHLSFVKYCIETTFNVEFQGIFSWKLIVIISAVITIVIYTFQFYIGIQNYRQHKLELLRGIYINIPSALNFNLNTILFKSIRYFGFLVGHMAFGFIILFHLIIFILCVVRIITIYVPRIELLFTIIIPILVIYLLTMVTISIFGKCLFMRNIEEQIHLRHPRSFAIFIYFNFFIDCFLGIISCIIRLIKVTFLNIIFIGRLDYSLYGRSLEKLDDGYTAYVSYLHMEVAHTNPIMLAFCYSLYDDIVKRRPRGIYDDDDQLNHDEINVELKPMVIKNVSKKDDQKFNRQISNDIQNDEEEQIQTYSTISHLINPKYMSNREKTSRQKHARFRWFLVYTIFNNLQLLQLRKLRSNYIVSLYTIRNNLNNNQSIVETESSSIIQRETNLTSEISESDVDNY